MGSIIAHHGLLFVGGGVVAQYWNPLDKATEITLSGSNKIATRSTTNNNNWRSVRSVTAHSSGKWYAECTSDVNGASNGSMIFGVGTASANINSYPGLDANSWGNQANNPTTFLYLAGTAINDGGNANISGGGYATIAIDFDAGKGWMGNSNAGWYDGGAPATGTSARFTFTPNTTLYLMLGENSSAQQCTLRTALADMAGSIPSGFNPWG